MTEETLQLTEEPHAAAETAGTVDPLPPQDEVAFEEADHVEQVPPDDIVAYNEVRSCADLIRLHKSGRMEVQPDFQREVVWRLNDQSRFIDSLVKQLPIPSMCFSLDHRTQRWKVIDGLQRMSSIIRFLGEEEWRLSKLSDIHPDLQGATNIELRDGDDDKRLLYSLVENVSIPITVIRCDHSKRNHMRYLFTIFHRLNSGGVRLNNQEIRNCIYTGQFNDMLKEFDTHNQFWQTIKRRIWGSVNRFRSVEVLLRVLAFGDTLEAYDGNLANYLNAYMHDNADLPVAETRKLADKLAIVADLATKAIDDGTTAKLPLATIEAVLVGIYVNLATLSTATAAEVRLRYLDMLDKPSFSTGPSFAVSAERFVKDRLGDAIKAFG